MIEDLEEKYEHNKIKKIIALILIGLITIASFTIFVYSYFNRDISKPTQDEIKTINLHAREIVNEPRNTRNVISETNRSDLSNYLLTEGAHFELQEATITKEGDSSNNDDSRNIGLNSAIVTSYKAYFSIYNSTITTLSVGSNAVYTSGTNSISEINDTDIITERPYSSAFISSTGGEIKVNHASVYTKSIKSPSIDTVTSDSKITAKSCLFETNGSISPIINASGIVSIDRSTGNSYSAPIAILKNTGDVTIHESAFLAAAGGVPEGFEPTGILIYGNKRNTEPQKFTSYKSSLNIDRNYPFYNKASLFYIKDTNANINLTNTSLNFGSGVLAYIYDSNVEFIASNQSLTGNILISGNSSLNLYLKYGSTYDISLSSDKIIINLDTVSSLNLIGDTYIKELNNEDSTNSNINFNSYHLYVDGLPIN